MDGLYIDLGVDKYSKTSLDKIDKLNNKLQSNLYVVSLPQIYNTGVKDLAKNNPRSACSACGLIKRYIMNVMTKYGNYKVIATGHNLDNETSTLLGNTLH
ncbi:hypothetical protein [Natranaerobius trueperi]|uniref:hypothetical protein n=1 Tax=Natranaerobius trueperi TaxID=759412 RepID=UPI00197BF037|nr:hypothetical protein [Natranaerobius trueperi]